MAVSLPKNIMTTTSSRISHTDGRNSLSVSRISLTDISIYAYHGVLPQERTVGGEYSVSLSVDVDVSKAVVSDSIADTLNYSSLSAIVVREMAQPSALLEHVAGRIGQSVLEEFPQVAAVDVSVVKKNPPLGVKCAGAGVSLHLINDKTAR